ncbi:MAG TPA: pyrroloquinoline quinone-dependent dehydrogenase [Bryobacteraceae bacterium]|nr:pyrroloquinoline quinone-dependent dehydrogenase [Bryobacteraceae bacterium]
MNRILTMFVTALVLAPYPLSAQRGTTANEWRFYGGDAGSTKYSPAAEINESNVKDLQIAWRWKAQNFGKRPDFNWQVTPLMVNGVLYFTAGTRRAAIAIDAVTAETLWMYRLDEGERGDLATRPQNRGLAYWSDGKGDERILLISPGFQLVALNAKTGTPIPSFGTGGIVDLTEGLDRPVVKPGQIGSSSPALVISDTVVVGAALQAGTIPASKENVPGYIRGYDVRTGKKIWTFKTIPQKGEFGNETWEQDSWKYTGNTGAWAPLTGDPELGYVYIPVEAATSDFYGGHRPGANLFADSIVCLDARTGKRIWHYQLVHHNIWDYDTASPPILLDVPVDGRLRKVVAQPSKVGFLYVFDRVTGEPIWPIVEKPVPQSDVPGEKTHPTQPFPTKPAPYELQGVSLDDLIDFTPELKAEAVQIASQYKLGPLFTPAIVPDTNGKKATLVHPNNNGATNWAGGAADPETGVVYVSSVKSPVPMAVAPPDPKRSDLAYAGRMGSGRPGGAPAPAGGPDVRAPRINIGPQSLPLVKPPWGRITAIDLKTGDHLWMVANGPAPEAIRNHPAMKGIDLSQAGQPERSPILVTKTLLFTADGSGLFAAAPGAGGPMFRAHNKQTGKVVFEMKLPANVSGVPMTYTVDDKQYIVMPIGAAGVPAELIALALP